MHVVFRLSDHPLRIFEEESEGVGRSVGHAIVGGARERFYVRDISAPVVSVGAELHSGASDLLLGVPAGELAGTHTPLDALWGGVAARMRERLSEAACAERRLDLFEAMLAARLPRVRGLHPAVAHALHRFGVTSDVREVVRQTGYSHRRFIALFREAVGLTPKVHCRVGRFHRLLEMVAARPAIPWSAAALAAGYSDQPHMTREFRTFAGMTPGEYRLAAPHQSHHVSIRPGG
jgi:AraC-like DNA-binding protein